MDVQRQGQGKINERLKQSNHNNYNLMGFDTVEINLVHTWLSENKKTGLMRMVSVENWLSKLLFKYWTNSDQ